MSCELSSRAGEVIRYQTSLIVVSFIFFRHKSLLDYLQTQGFSATYEALQQEAGQEGFVPDPKAKYAGLLERKWTSVIRMQKKVSTGTQVTLLAQLLTQPILHSLADHRARTAHSSAH